MATGKPASDKERKIANPTKVSRSIPTHFDVISDTIAHVDDYYGLQPLDAPVFTEMKDVDGNVIADVSDLNNLPIGIVSPLAFSSVTLTSGSIIAFKR